MPLDLQKLRNANYTDKDIVDNFGSQLGVDVERLRAEYAPQYGEATDTILAENFAAQYDTLAAKKAAPAEAPKATKPKKYDHGAIPVVPQDAPAEKPWVLDADRMINSASGLSNPTSAIARIEDIGAQRNKAIEASKKTLEEKGFLASSEEVAAAEAKGKANRKMAQDGVDRVKADQDRAKRREGRPGVGRQIINDTRRGIDNLSNIGTALVALGDDVLGLDKLSKQGLREYVAESNRIAAENPAVIGSFDKIESVSDFGRYATEAVFENLAMFVPSLVTGGIGASVARKGAEKLVAGMVAKETTRLGSKEAAEKSVAGFVAKQVTKGATAGALPAGVGMEAGNIYWDIYKETGKQEAGVAAAFGLAAGALEIVEPVLALRKALGPVADDVAQSIFKRYGPEVGKQVIAEGGTEFAQTLIESGAISYVDGREWLSEENLHHAVDAMLKGGIAGGVIGAGSQVVADVRTPQAAAGGLTPAPTAPSPQAGPVPSAESLQAAADEAARKSQEFAALADEARALGDTALADHYESQSQAAAAAAKQSLDTLQTEHTGLQGIVNRTGITPPALIPEEATRTVEGELLPADGGAPIALPAAAQAQGQLPPPDEQVMVADSQGNVSAMGVNSVNAMRQGAEQAQRDAVIDRGDLIVPSDAVPAPGKSKPRPVNPDAAGLSAANKRLQLSADEVAAGQLDSGNRAALGLDSLQDNEELQPVASSGDGTLAVNVPNEAQPVGAASSVASPFYIKHPQTGEDVPVDSIEDADSKFKALIASTGADFEGGMDVFDATTNQPVANLKPSGKPTKVETADESLARSAEAIGKMATVERVDEKPTGEQEMRKRMAYLRGAIAASSDNEFKATAKTELRELTNKINSLKNADPATVSPETVKAPATAEASLPAAERVNALGKDNADTIEVDGSLSPEQPAAAPKTGASPTGLRYPNRKLGFEVARIEDGGDPSSWANIALANLQPDDKVTVNGVTMTVKSIGAKAVTFTKPDGKTTRFDVDTPRMEQLVRDVAGLLEASHHSSHGRDWVSVLSRDPTFGRTAGVTNLQDRGTEATASVDAMNLAARHARLDRAIDQLSDAEVHALYRKMGLAGEFLNVDKKREALKQEHPDDTEAAMKAKPEAAKPEVSDNTVFTEDAAEKAREVLRQALRGTQLNTGLDPKVLQAALTLSGYHVERGARTFAAYSQAMIKDLGDEVRPYLKSFYMALKYDPKAAGIAEGMSSEAEVNAEPRTEDRRQTDEAVAVDRRSGPRRVDDMTPDEMRQALLFNPLTDLPNKRAFEEDADLGWPHVAAMDIDGFGFLNDIWGHDPVDAILKQIGGMMSGFSTDAVRLYHRSGDEFAARSNDKEALQLVLKSLQDHLEASTFTVDGVSEDGRPLKFIKHGIGVTFGISTDYQRADNEANADKERRLAAGQRGAKGTNPGGMVEVDAEGVQADLGPRGISRQETERLRNRGSEGGLDPEQAAANRQEDIRQQRSQRMKAMLAERAKFKPTDELLTAVAKLGGLSKADAESQGIDPAYFSEQRAGIKFVFRPSGKSFDAMAEALDAEGYPVQDDQGRYSANVLLDLVTRSLSGNPVYTSAGYDAMMAAEEVQRALEEGDVAELERLAPASPDATGFDQAENGGEFLPQTRSLASLYGELMGNGWPLERIDAAIEGMSDAIQMHNALAALLIEEVPNGQTESRSETSEAVRPVDAAGEGQDNILGFNREASQGYGDLTDAEIERTVFDGLTIEQVLAERQSDDFSLETQSEADLAAKEAREQDEAAAAAAEAARQAEASSDTFGLSTGIATTSEQVRPATRGQGLGLFDQRPTTRGEAKQDLAASPAPAKIADAGESLRWNRKNPWRSGGLKWDDVADKNVTLRMSMAVKSKIWAKPDWEEYLAEVPDDMRDAVTLAARMVKQVYDAIATKPRTEAGVKDYIESVTSAREAAEAFLKDTDAVREFALAMAAKAQARLARRVSILDVIGSTSQTDKKKSQPLFAAMFPESIGQRRFAESEEGMARAIGRKAVAALQFDIADVVKAMKDISDNGWPSKREAWQVRGYTVVERDGVFVLRHKPGGSRFTRDISEHGSEAEAIEAARALVARPQSETEPRPEAIALDRLTRTGPHRRQAGEDVTPQDLIDTFGFRGINFGNYVPNDERQAHVNHAFDSMLDLAEALDLPPAAMSLGGMLGLAFGAQGNGGRNNAHFVPGVNEINLTRKSGAGALAHEWAHAVDHYFGVLGGLATAKEPFASWLHMFRRTGESSIRPEVKSAFESIVNAMQKSKETIGDARNRIESYRVTSKQNLDAHIARYALDDKVAGNADASAALEQIKNGEPGEYVEKPRRPRQRRAEATNANVLAVAQAAGLDNVDLELLTQAARSYSFAIKEAVDEANLRTVHTEFYRDSKTADRDDKRDYWATNHEMFARAFEAYVLDKLASKEARNDYLVKASIAEGAVAERALKVYPIGADRKAINDGFDALFGTVQHKQEDGKTLLYSRGFHGSPHRFDKFSLEHLIAPVLAKWKNGPRVVVVQSTSDLPGGAAPHDVEGAYGGNGVVYLVADNLPTEERILEVLSHEAVGHAAMESMLGADLMAELTKEIGAWERRGSAFFVKLGKDVDASQPDLPADRRAKEIVALMAERGLHKQGSLWKRVTGAIRAWLRDLGFTGKWLDSLTDADMFKMLADAERYLEDGRSQSGKRNAEAALAYSRRGNFGTAQSFAEAVDRALRIPGQIDKALEVGRTPDVLKAVGAPDLQVVVSKDVLLKASNGVKHDVSVEALKRLPELLADPVMVFDSKTESGALVVLTEVNDKSGRPVVVALHLNRTEKRFVANKVASIYGKDGADKFVANQVGNGRLLYKHAQKSLDWLQSIGLQLPKEGANQGHESKVLTDADIFNGEGTNGTAPRGVEEAKSTDAGRDRGSEARIAEGIDSSEGTVPPGEVTPGNPLFSRSSPSVVGDAISSLTGGNHQHDSEFHEELRRLREADKTAWSKAKNWWKRNFYAGGLLPEGVFDAKIQRDGAFNAIEHDVRHLTGTLSAMVKKEYGKDLNKLPEADKALMAEALAGKWPGDAVKLETRSTLLAMRKYIDSLSGEYTKYLADKVAARLAMDPDYDLESDADARLMQTIAGNIGTYVHRSYRAFDDKNWYKNVPAKVVDDAMRYLMDRHIENGMDDAEARRRAEVAINDIIKNGTAYDSMDSFIAEGKLGAKDLSVLIKRKQIAPEIRALLGEYTDPRLNFAKSATKMARLVWNQRLLDRVRDIGVGSFLFDEDTKPAAATVQIAGESSEVYAPLNGLWTTPEVAQAFKDILGKDQLSDLMRHVVAFNAAVKYGKTVLSPTTAMRNIQSALFFTVANGHFDYSKASKAIKAFKEQVLGKTGDAYMRRMLELGVTYDTPNMDELKQWVEQSGYFMANEDAIAPRKWLSKLNERVQGFYRFGDDFWKIIGFENEKAALLKSGLSLAEAEAQAAERIRNTYPTYSMIGRGTRWISRFPLVGTFVSFPAEIIRTSGHMFKYMAQDLASGNPELRKMGAKRLVGMALVSGGFYALSALTKAAFDLDDDDEEAIRVMAPEWSKNSTFLYWGRNEKTGQLEYTDLSFLDPYGHWKRPITAMMRDQPWDEALASGLVDMLSPFLSWDITTNTILEVIRNENAAGSAVYDETARPGTRAGQIGEHLAKSLQPGFVGNAQRLLAASKEEKKSSGQPYVMKDELMALVGWRHSTVDPKTAIRYRAMDYLDKNRIASGSLTRVLRKQNAIDDKDIVTAVSDVVDAKQRVYKDMAVVIKAAIRSGMEDIDVEDLLKVGGVSEDAAISLAEGEMPEITLSMTSLDKAIEAADIAGDDARVEELYRRYDIAEDALEALGAKLEAEAVADMETTEE